VLLPPRSTRLRGMADCFAAKESSRLRVIALHSPNPFLETGLRNCPSEKSRGKGFLRCWAVRSLQSALSRDYREIRACFADSATMARQFSGSSDCVAGEEFEPSVRFASV
jgi:hypothetical protein